MMPAHTTSRLRLFCLLLALASLPSCAQTAGLYRIAGTVVNAVSGEPVRRATVAVLGLEDGRTIERIQMSNNAINGFVPDRLKRHLQRLPVPKQLRDIPAPVREGATKRLIKRLKPEQFDRQVKRTSAMRAGLKTQKAA